MERNLIKCPECNSADHVAPIRKVIMGVKGAWLDPPPAGGFCTKCKKEIEFGHIAKINKKGQLEIHIDNVKTFVEAPPWQKPGYKGQGENHEGNSQEPQSK